MTHKWMCGYIPIKPEISISCDSDVSRNIFLLLIVFQPFKSVKIILGSQSVQSQAVGRRWPLDPSLLIPAIQWRSLPHPVMFICYFCHCTSPHLSRLALMCDLKSPFCPQLWRVPLCWSNSWKRPNFPWQLHCVTKLVTVWWNFKF